MGSSSAEGETEAIHYHPTFHWWQASYQVSVFKRRIVRRSRGYNHQFYHKNDIKAEESSNKDQLNLNTQQHGMTPVLNFLEKQHLLNQLRLRDAVGKVATLLALTTAQRFQTLALIDIIIRSDSEISIKITDHIKTSKPGTSTRINFTVF
ncbi:uncharacterized protein [Anoplolepis gracilipes]|uniref:uncharacterized protein n=1 Tax=Anoplolepis gracilipes TaxID=354296 RepID=UPI003BA1EC7E